MKLLLGIDIGTSGAKAVATDLAGRRIADASARYPTSTDGAGAEQNAEHWWEAVAQILPSVVAGGEVLAVAVTSQAPTLVPVDAVGSPTGPALTWLDRRAVTEGLELAETVPESRNGADPFFGTAKLPWMARHRASALSRAAYVLSSNGFLVHRLTGKATLDDTTASLMQGFDEISGTFDDRLLRQEPSVGLLAPVVPSTSVVGTVTARAAAALGLAEGTPVVAGGIDSIGSALEAGALRPGDPLVDMTGFSSVTISAVPAGIHVPGFIHCRHCLEGTDLLITAQVTAGAAVDWVNSLDSTRDLRDDEALLSRPRPGRLTMVPSLAGERTPSWNPAARGIIAGIDLSTDGTDLLLAAMEGNALGLAADVATMTGHGYPVDRVLSTGGGASSRAWLQIKADVLGLPVMKPKNGHGAAQGAAALAGLGVGVYTSAEDLYELTRRIDEEFLPDTGKREAYRAARRRYRELTALNRPRPRP